MKKGFTLLEVIIVISILGALIGMNASNFTTSLKRGRDVKRKAELASMRTALQLYFIDYGLYPAGAGGGGGNYMMNGCGTAGNLTCPASGCTVQFGVGNATCDATIYMNKLPSGYGNTGSYPLRYYSTASQANFCLVQKLELTSDTDIALSQSRCATQCAGISPVLTSSEYVACNE